MDTRDHEPEAAGPAAKEARQLARPLVPAKPLVQLPSRCASAAAWSSDWRSELPGLQLGAGGAVVAEVVAGSVTNAAAVPPASTNGATASTSLA